MDVGNNLFFVSFSAAHPPNGRLIRNQGKKQTGFTYLIITTEVFPPYCSAGGGLFIPLGAIPTFPSVAKAGAADLGVAKEAKPGAITRSGGQGAHPCSSPGYPVP